MTVAYRETTKPLLRPDQVDSFGQEAKRLRDTVNAPPHIRNQVQDMSNMRAQLRRLETVLSDATPRAYHGPERDAARARLAELEAQITAGMPTQEEMRRNPPGAVDKHMKWERRNKPAILEWKNIRRRMHATECEGGVLENVKDHANVEILRPHGLARSMDMAGAQIERPIMMLPDVVTPATVISDAETAWLAARFPSIHAHLSTYTNAQREALMAEVRQMMPAAKPAPQPRAAKQAKPARKPMSAEARKAAGDRLRALNAAKRAAKQQAA